MGGVVFLILFSVGTTLFAETFVRPVIDRPGECLYCQAVKEAFAQAQQSIDLLLSDAQLAANTLWEDLLAAASRGVGIRVLLDASDWAPSITEKNRATIDFLVSHGIDARFDDPAVTTHAKLVIVDRRVVILGSSNWNRRAFTAQEQTNIAVEDEQVGEVFAVYFDRLWSGELSPGCVWLDSTSFTQAQPLLAPIPETVDTANYARVLLTLLPQAKTSVHVVMYRASYYPGFPGSLSNEILQGLIAASGRGLDVRILLDDCAFYPESAEANLEAALYLHLHGVETRFDDPTETTHAKLVLIDGETVLLGSTNWNYYSLEKNNEVDLVLAHLPAVATVYESYFHLLWRRANAIGNK